MRDVVHPPSQKDSLRSADELAESLAHLRESTGEARLSHTCIDLMEELLGRNGDNPAAYVALAQVYTDASRGSQAVKLLQDAQAKFPSSTTIAFELGATLEKQKNYVEAEAALKHVLVIEPDNAAALNYIGYMLAERGERLPLQARG